MPLSLSPFRLLFTHPGNISPNPSLFKNTIFYFIHLTEKRRQALGLSFSTSNLRIEFHPDAGFIMETKWTTKIQYNVHQIPLIIYCSNTYFSERKPTYGWTGGDSQVTYSWVPSLLCYYKVGHNLGYLIIVLYSLLVYPCMVDV